jgi:small conductance mechanosensitive channel
VKKQAKKAEEKAEAESATTTEEAATDENTAEEVTDDEVGVDGEATEARTQQMVESLPELQEEQAELSERLEVILNALEHKGGDPTAYRQYITAIRGIDLAVTDARTGWAMLTGWLTSEQGGKRWMWNIIKFLVILMAFYFGASIIAGFVRRAASRVKNASQLLIAFLGKFVKQVTMVIGVIVALAALEVNIAPLLAAVGAAGFVVGFALQDTLSNFASGLLILAYNPFDEDDVIEAAGVSGMVSSVSLFSTHIRTFDNKVMIVPNNDIWGGTITNATASKTRRVDMVFGIGYEDDVDQAKKILETLVQEHELVLPAPAPVVQMNELGDSSINFICRPWTKTSDFWTVYWDITRAVKIEFDRNGISIPFPQQDIHVYQETKQTDA